ncbi:MAG: chromosome segregation protein SMC [Elusimicrobia bacterium GWA2_69_24]|nr:MAG: chromosome segregation protein SMC [Elusimicrobia bacterium GWA2_69_24]
MHLKSIEIQGFKSFADKTRIEVKPGITGIIGPNGCGKSNIMDAIRWCIGEMSWKSLRSDSMVSVIFAGTERRNAVGLAEVTLTFDNARNLLPVPYSEIQVSRRIFRSGESEYYYNKTQCRLRDIRELFLDTGIGNSGYAIIGQGDVDFILRSKPEDRRALFEEAAGVSKYNVKREEAIRKMEHVEVDLGRLQDSVALIDEQIKKLDSDARKAKLYQKYKAELASMEAGQILGEVRKLDADLKTQEEQAGPLRERMTAMISVVDADDARLAALHLEKAAQDAAVLASNQKVAALQSEIRMLDERVRNANDSAARVLKNLEDSREQLEAERGRAAAMDPEIGGARQAHAEAAAALEQCRREEEEFRAELNRLIEERDAAHESAKAIRQKARSVSETLQGTSREESAAQSRQDKLGYELERNRKETETLETKLQDRRDELGRLEGAAGEQRSRLDRACQTVAELETRRTDLSGQHAGTGDAIVAMRAEAAALKARIEAVESQGGQDPYWVGAHAVTDAGIPGIAGTVRSLLRVHDEHRVFVEDALGDRLYAVVCDDVAAARAGIEFLKCCGRGRVRFLVSSALPEGPLSSAELPSGARNLLEAVSFDPAHERVVRHLLAETFMLDGGLYGRCWVCGGAREGESLQMQLSDIGELRGRLERFHGRLEAEQRRKAELEEAIRAADRSLAEARGRRETESAAFHRLDGELQNKREGLKLDEGLRTSILVETERLASDITALQEQRSGLGRRLEELRGQEAALQGEADAAQARGALIHDGVQRKLGEETHFKQVLQDRGERERIMKDRRDRLVADKAGIEASALKRQDQQGAWERDLKEYAGVVADSNRQLEGLHRGLAGGEGELRVLVEKQQSLQKDSEDLEAKLKQSRHDADALREDLKNAELRLSELKNRRHYLCGRLWTEWQLSYEEAALRYQEQPVDEERLQFLRRRIEALGNINMAAPEEYEDFVKRRDNLQAQIDDLNQARQDLHSVIAKINAATRENFRQTYTEVREHFRRLYGILFEGGEGDVVLTDPENLLETGVEIVAQPPGKRLQSISQLSGGEKTLTAIALLFAFFMVKPSPMCMLDEADAALDDANIDRFVAMLREFTDKTQFLIVSHSKKTMEACDAIYGITMEESGVSQILSVDFRKKSGTEAAVDGVVETLIGAAPDLALAPGAAGEAAPAEDAPR